MTGRYRHIRSAAGELHEHLGYPRTSAKGVIQCRRESQLEVELVQRDRRLPNCILFYYYTAIVN